MKSTREAFLGVAAAAALMLAACGESADTTTTAAAPETTAAPVTEAAAPEAADTPSQMRVAFIAPNPIDDPWYTSGLDSLARLEEARPYGLDVSTQWFENIAYADGERVFRELASSGEYDMIIGHSTYSDAVDAVKDDYPDIAFVFSGSGNEPVGGNGFWIDTFIHEPAYLTGVAAGLMTQTDKIGIVANYPFPNVNAPVNAYIAGAESVNPNVEWQVSFIESWWDPATAKVSAAAQIAAGADVLYAVVFGVYEAAEEAGDVYAVGDLADAEALSPGVVITSTVARWDQAIMEVIDAWWDQHVNGVPMSAPMERIMFFMPDGGGDIAPMNEDLVPQDVRDAVLEARDRIMSGELVVELDDSPPEQ